MFAGSRRFGAGFPFPCFPQGTARRALAAGLIAALPVTALAQQAPVSVDAIQKMVCEFYNISLSDIKAKRRTKDIALPRQIAMYLAKQVTEASLNDIGKNFGGKDHATVIYACRQIEERRTKDETFNRIIENLLQKIKN